MLPLLLASVILVSAAFAMFSLRILFIKNGVFRGTCAGNSSFLRKEGVVCGVCGSQPGEDCKKDETPAAPTSGTRA